ncbi:MAG TPA: D-aminoacylase, partial [Vicinamibacteria bacterium]|nr:D-aminoacylase [Vicinamibacteria bacterium]
DPRPAYDLLLRGGRVIDGSGNPWYAADVGVRDGRVAAVGPLDPARAARVIDVSGLVVAPGFVDVHAHVEGSVRARGTADNFVADGVTALVTGNCGGSDTDLPALFTELEQKGISLNLATLIGHNSVRRAVMGAEERDPTAEDLARMEAIVDRAMKDGAVGLSTGLIYVPGTYAKTDEIVALARVAARHGGLYASHIRNEGDRVFEAIDEAIGIGRAASLPVEISHFKISNKRLWGRSEETLARVDRARREGIDVTVDQYPYTASSTNLGTLLPSWALAGGTEEMKKRLADPPTRRKVVEAMKRRARESKRKKYDYAVVARCEWDPSREGKSINQLSRERGRKGKLADDIETVLDMMAKGGAGMVYHSMHEEDVERILRHPYSMVASDAGIPEPGVGAPHPRGYGTNARVLGRYVRDRRAVRLEEAIRKMTSLPAQRFGLLDRGLVRPGMWADLVAFDPATVRDTATFEKPHAYAEGFRYVIVNGAVVIDGGRHTGARPGKVLKGPGAVNSVSVAGEAR